MYLKAGKTIYEIAGKPAIAWAKNFLKSNPSVKVISSPTKAQMGRAKTVTSPPKDLTDVQKAARSRKSQQEFLKAEKPARKRQEGIQSAREQRRWKERDAETVEMADPDKEYIWGTKRKKGGKVGKKSSGKHADGNKVVASLYD